MERKRREKLSDLLVRKYGKEIIESNHFVSTRNHTQHGTVSVHQHSMNVAKMSVKISKMLRIKCKEQEMVRGALLHDYFLYDWHDKEHVNITKLHGFYHPGIALDNARKEYALSEREQDIIRKHMWPLTVVPPLCREAWIVTAADKYCSLMETIRLHHGDRAQ